ncbi:aspartic peptidase domain-containing protein [Blakeslea trispora]|nr:aspartic peptidase domain-containing protein [Blakeslea trispora]
MKFSFIKISVIAQLVLLSVSANSIQRIPLYYQKRHYPKNDIVTTKVKQLKNGMLGGVFQIGSPPQEFILAFDTSKGFSWVRTVDCKADNCQGRCSFDSKASTTYQPADLLFTMDYGKGIVNTTIFHDTMQFGSLKVEQMPIGGAYYMENFDQGFDGFLGLGRSVNLTNPGRYEKRNIPESGFVPIAYQQGSGIRSAQFSMYTTEFKRGFSDSGSVSKDEMTSDTKPSQQSTIDSQHEKPKPTSFPSYRLNQEQRPASKQLITVPGGTGTLKKRHYKKDMPAGYLVIGGVDYDAIKGKLHHIPLNDECSDSQDWAVSVRDAGFEDSFQIHKHARAILSTSTDVIGLPNKQGKPCILSIWQMNERIVCVLAEEFRKRWFAVYDQPDNTFMIPCCLMDRLSSFKIQLGDIQIIVPPHYWSHPREVDSCCEMCRTHIGKSDSEKNFIIGSSFTNAFYTQYDTERGQIGLALKKDHADDNLEIYQV